MIDRDAFPKQVYFRSTINASFGYVASLSGIRNPAAHIVYPASSTIRG
jgi:hypothetical protein